MNEWDMTPEQLDTLVKQEQIEIMADENKCLYTEVDDCSYKFSNEVHDFVQVDFVRPDGEFELNLDNSYLIFRLGENDYYLERYVRCERVSLELVGHSYDEALNKLKSLIEIV